MSESQTRRQKRTDDEPIRKERSYHAVPADWVRMGRHEHQLDRDRFYAEKVCYEYRLEHDDGEIPVRERQLLFVLYRNPDTDEAVERTYRAAAINTDADTVETTTSAVDGDIGPKDWGTIDYASISPTDGLAVIPKTVHDGEPFNFRASVAPHPDEPRIN